MERFELPDGWDWHRLGDVAEVMLGKTPKRAHYANSGIKVVKFRDVSSRGIDWNNDESGFASEAATDLRYLKRGDVLLTASAHNADSIGKKSCVVTDWPTKFGRVAFVGELLCARADATRILPGWILSWFSSEQGGVAVSEQVEGVHLTSGRAQEIEIPVPPLAEQRRLVARIEALTSRLEQARQARQAALAEADSSSRSIIAAAFAALSEAPTKKLGDIAGIIGGAGFPEDGPRPVPENERVGLLKVSDMNAGGNETLLQCCRLETTLAHARELRLRVVPCGAVVFPKRGGAIATNKKRTLAIPAALDPNMMGVFPLEGSGLSSEFLRWWFESIDLAELQEDGGIPQVNKKHLDPLEIPVPSPAEQRRLVSRLDALAAKQTELRRLQTETEAALAAFTPALLAKAFRGEL